MSTQQKKKNTNSLPSFFLFMILFCFPTLTPFLLSSRKRQIKETTLPPIHVGFLLKKYDLLDFDGSHLSCVFNKVLWKRQRFSASHLLFFSQGCFLHCQCCVFWWEGLVCSCLQNTEFNCLAIAVVQSYSVPVSLTSSVNSPVSFLSLWALK